MASLLHYRLSGARVASEIALPAAPTSPRSSPTGGEPASPLVTYHLAAALGDPAPVATSWDHRDNGLSIGRCRGGLVVHFPGYADFRVAEDGSEVVGAPVDGASPETLTQLFLDQVLPLALHARGRFAFHASSVAVAGRDLVAFLGNSGAGKSTLASSLAGPGEAGDVLFSDDCLAVEPLAGGILAHPSYAATRLWPESASALFAGRDPLPLASPRTAKLRAALPAAVDPLPLRRLYLIEGAEGPPVLTRLRRRDALMRLAGHLYRLDTTNRRLLAAEIDLLERVVATVPVATLAYRRVYADLPAVREVITADLGG